VRNYRLCCTLHWMRRFWTQSLGVPVLYQIRLRVTDDSTRFLANRYSADCSIGVKCPPTELYLPLVH
jgi:hypothetical protein